MIGWAFNQLFLAGDVIYGISRPRGRYTRTLQNGIVGKSAQALIDEGNFTICDHYNNRSFNAPTVMGNFKGPDAQAGENAMNFFINNGLNTNQQQPVTNYYNLLSGHKYNPHTAMNLAMNEKQKRHNNNQNDYLAFRRACKFGLDYFMLQLGKRVHFILDVDEAGTCIDFEKIVFKELFVNTNNNNQEILPITYSELRRCYKNRVIYGNKLFFYLDGVRVDAPWDQDPELWSWIDKAKELKLAAAVTNIEEEKNGQQIRANRFVQAPAKKSILTKFSDFVKKRKK